MATFLQLIKKKNLHALGKCCLGLAGYLHENVQLSLEEWAGGLMSVGSEHPWFGWVPPRNCSVVFLEEWTGGLTSVGCEHSLLGFLAKEGCLIQLAVAQHWSACSCKHHLGSDDLLSPLLAVRLTQPGRVV